MATATKIYRNFYRDSVILMRISSTLGKWEGVRQFSAVMASDNNLALLQSAGLLTAQVVAGPNDLLVVAEGDSEAAVKAVLAQTEVALNEVTISSRGKSEKRPPRSLAMALEEQPRSKLALISTPGVYAASEALKALKSDLNVMIFSNNVSLEDELRLKRLAQERELLVMGPDCGTAIVGGVPLAFANVVKHGPIGVVGASGSGIQQVTCLVDAMDCGISHALGTGARDLSREVGGLTMVRGIRALAEDPETKVIVLISKPPATEVAKTILAAASTTSKPVVVTFLGTDPISMTAPGVIAVRTLEEAASTAVTIAKGGMDYPPLMAEPDLPVSALSRLAPGQRYVRGLFSGGTLCYEAAMLLADSLEGLSTNTPLRPEMTIADPWRSTGHTLLDMGAEVFTRGRPHPMIDLRLRCERLEHDAVDPETAVLLLDIILGFGSHPDPASELVSAINRAREQAAAKGLAPLFMGFVCGTAGDPQNFKRQCAALEDAGVLLAASNAQAARLVARIAAAIPTAKCPPTC